MTINPQEIQRKLQTRWVGQRIYFRPVVESTNDLLRDMALQGEPEGALLVTDFQSQGKGRLGRQWLAPAGSSLLFSLLFRPDWPASQANWLTMMAGMAATRAINEETGLSAALKWPNDIVLIKDDQPRKTGGILLESMASQQQLSQVILGTGLNVNIPASELPQTSTPATSLAIELGRSVSRQDILIRLLHELELLYVAAEAGHSPQPAWNDLLVTLGQQVRVTGAGQQTTIEGDAVGTDSWGRLLVRNQQGKIHAIAAGDVTLRG